MLGQLGAELGTNATDVNVDRAAAAEVVEAPHATQKRITRVGAPGMRYQKGQKGVLQIGEVNRLAADGDLVGGQIDGHGVDHDEIARGAFVAGPQKLADAQRALLGAGAVHDEVGVQLNGQAEIAQVLLGNDDQDGRSAVVDQGLLDRGKGGCGLGAVGLVDDEVVRGILADNLLELQGRPGGHVDVQAAEDGLELVRVIKAVGDENDVFTLHSYFPPRLPADSARVPKRKHAVGIRSIHGAWPQPGSHGCARRGPPSSARTRRRARRPRPGCRAGPRSPSP